MKLKLLCLVRFEARPQLTIIRFSTHNSVIITPQFLILLIQKNKKYRNNFRSSEKKRFFLSEIEKDDKILKEIILLGLQPNRQQLIQKFSSEYDGSCHVPAYIRNFAIFCHFDTEKWYFPRPKLSTVWKTPQKLKTHQMG